jgi:hypothetical protein
LQNEKGFETKFQKNTLLRIIHKEIIDKVSFETIFLSKEILVSRKGATNLVKFVILFRKENEEAINEISCIKK